MADLKVIGAGLGRTGTKSLKDALEILGLRCYHMTEVFEANAIEQWGTALSTKLEDSRRGRPARTDKVVDLLEGYDATMDFPACLFHSELKQLFPDAKIILTVREPGKWYMSIKSTIAHFAFSWPVNFLWLFAGSRRFWRLVGVQIWRVWGQEMESGCKDVRAMLRDEALMLRLYQQYNVKIRRQTKPEDLLVYSVREGWEPLCNFLSVPIPETPFPYVNDTEAYKTEERRELVKGLAHLVGGALAISVAVACTLPSVTKALRR